MNHAEGRKPSHAFAFAAQADGHLAEVEERRADGLRRPTRARAPRLLEEGLAHADGPCAGEHRRRPVVEALEQLGREHRRCDACNAVGDGEALDRLEQYDEPAFERLEEGL